jgi:23S rRNA-/tRNA-specific pseudouridylate synthase
MPSTTKVDPEKMEEEETYYNFKPSLTKCTILEYGATQLPDDKSTTIRVTKVQLSPITGRRHQLRIHMALTGHPILGDMTYSEQSSNTNAIANQRVTSSTSSSSSRAGPCSRMCLHAYSLSLPSLLGETEPNWKTTTPDPFSFDDNGNLKVEYGM